MVKWKHAPLKDARSNGVDETPKPFVAQPLREHEGFLGESTNKIPLKDCLPRVSITDVVKRHLARPMTRKERRRSGR